MKRDFAVIFFDHVSPWAVDAVKVFEGSWKKCKKYLLKLEKEGYKHVYEMDIAPNFDGQVTNAQFIQTFDFWDE